MPTEEFIDYNFIKNTLMRIHTDLIDDEELFDDKLFEDALHAISLIGNNQLYNMKHLVYDALNSKEAHIRDHAIATLAYDTRLGLKEFRDQAYEIWKTDPSPMVRNKALGAWVGYYFRTKNPKVIEILYKILIDENYDVKDRYEALAGIYDVTDEESNFYAPYDTIVKLTNSRNNEELNVKIDWQELTAVVKKHAPKALKFYPVKAKEQYVPDIYKLLEYYENLLDDSKPLSLKSMSLLGFYNLAKMSFSFFNYGNFYEFAQCKTLEEFNNKINWEELKSVIKKHAPEYL